MIEDIKRTLVCALAFTLIMSLFMGAGFPTRQAYAYNIGDIPADNIITGNGTSITGPTNTPATTAGIINHLFARMS